VSAKATSSPLWTPNARETVEYALASGDLPVGLHLDAATGEVHGILTEPGVPLYGPRNRNRAAREP
jgi:hypothetical protein